MLNGDSSVGSQWGPRFFCSEGYVFGRGASFTIYAIGLFFWEEPFLTTLLFGHWGGMVVEIFVFSALMTKVRPLGHFLKGFFGEFFLIGRFFVVGASKRDDEDVRGFPYEQNKGLNFWDILFYFTEVVFFLDYVIY